MELNKVTIIGGGVLGTQIGLMCAYVGKDVTFWLRSEESVERTKPKLKRYSELMLRDLLDAKALIGSPMGKFAYPRGLIRNWNSVNADEIDEEYVMPEDAGFTEEYILSAWHVIPGSEKIPIKVHITEPLAESFRELKWHPTQKVIECSEGGIILTAEVPNLYETARWVMSGAPHIIVIEPDELKEIVIEFAEEILNKMKGESQL